MNKLLFLVTLWFLSFIIWVIYRADLGQPTYFHLLIRDVPYGDKIGHFFLFGVLSFLSNLALKLRRIKLFSFNFYLGSALVFAFAAIEEMSQALFPQRTLDLADLIAGALGIFSSGLLAENVAKRPNLMPPIGEVESRK